jgi:uncharacterized membrane protein
MTRERVLKIINLVFPAIGIGSMVFYEVCNTCCSSLQGWFMGLNLKVIGILFMAVLLTFALPPVSRWNDSVQRLRIMLLAGALGGETLLIRFQVLHNTYCPFCLAFGSCILILFFANFTKTNRYPALGAFLAGVVAFALFFDGSIVPLYR